MEMNNLPKELRTDLDKEFEIRCAQISEEQKSIDGTIKLGFDLFDKRIIEGVLIPDHAPQVTSKAPWDAGMAFAMGYLKALVGIIK